MKRRMCLTLGLLLAGAMLTPPGLDAQVASITERVIGQAVAYRFAADEIGLQYSVGFDGVRKDISCGAEVGIGCNTLVFGGALGTFSFGPETPSFNPFVARLLDGKDDVLALGVFSYGVGESIAQVETPQGWFLGGSGRSALESLFFEALLPSRGVLSIDRINLEILEANIQVVAPGVDFPQGLHRVNTSFTWTLYGQCAEGSCETPIRYPRVIVPEPSSYMLLLSCVLCLGFVAWRRRHDLVA